MKLDQILGQEAMTIVDASMVALKQTGMTSYNESGTEENRRRFLALIRLLIEAIQEQTLVPMQDYGKKVAKERHEKGYCLRDVFTAFNVLESCIWKRLMEQVEPSLHGKYLGLVSTILSRGKEALALKYVDLAVEDPNPIRDYQALLSRM